MSRGRGDGLGKVWGEGQDGGVAMDEHDTAGQLHTGTQDQGPADPRKVFYLHGLDCGALSLNRHHQFLLHRPSWGQPLCKLSSEAEQVCTKETGVAGTPLNGPCLGRRPTLGPTLLRGARGSWAAWSGEVGGASTALKPTGRHPGAHTIPALMDRKREKGGKLVLVCHLLPGCP